MCFKATSQIDFKTVLRIGQGQIFAGPPGLGSERLSFVLFCLFFCVGGPVGTSEPPAAAAAVDIGRGDEFDDVPDGRRRPGRDVRLRGRRTRRPQPTRRLLARGGHLRPLLRRSLQRNVDLRFAHRSSCCCCFLYRNPSIPFEHIVNVGNRRDET